MWFKGALLFSLIFILAACGGSTRAPVSERSLGLSQQAKPNEYRVKKGDTLYSIAFRYGIDYRELARNNNIDQRYSIYPGQTLRLNFTKPKPQGSIVRDSSIQAPKPLIVSSQKQNSPSSKSTIVSQSKPVQTKKPSDAVKSSQVKSKEQAKVAKVQTPQTKPAPKVQKSVKPISGPLKWKWPSSGKVIATFKTRGTVNKGINIAGSKGSSVKAAGRGRVVYAGSGLLGYGNLVIIDHNQQFLSAYAHNSRVLVKENDMVEVGQKIAEMGSSGADRVMLHFEIRRDGKPVNPLRYLPKR